MASSSFGDINLFLMVFLGTVWVVTPKSHPTNSGQSDIPKGLSFLLLVFFLVQAEMWNFLSSAWSMSHPIRVTRDVEHLMNVFHQHFQVLRSSGDGSCSMGESAYHSEFVLEWLVAVRLQTLVRTGVFMVHFEPEFSVIQRF